MNQMAFRPAPGVELFPIHDEALLFDQNGQRLFHLNAIATHIWSRLDSEMDVKSIANATAEAMCLDPAKARLFVLEMLKIWRGAGLLQDGCTFLSPQRTASPPHEALLNTSDKEIKRTILPTRQLYRLLDTVFSVGFSNASLADSTISIFRHLRTALDPVNAVSIDIIEHECGIQILHGNQILRECLSTREIIPLLQGLLGLMAIRAYGYLLAVHASCLARSDDVLLLAGKSGSGKTTMAAALMAAGWAYMSDDTALLLPQTLDCVGVPYPLTVKEPSWRTLDRYFPIIDQAPTHLRRDDQLVRYLSPPYHVSRRPRRVRWIGFPHHSANSSSMRMLDQVEGLYRLLEHCCAIPHFLNSGDIQQLVRWSASIRFFEFAIADIDDSVAQVAAVTGANAGRATRIPISDDSYKSSTACT
ncbi:PqqD family protein [Dongia deserti]|uniref:PqqD family protein n=1 Tax=Dongia deserti TaxID=2268030 RepID=UPI0013C48EA7|nr:PqqD family protein [Dongia deserti]